ncbi:hypothetical protein AB0F15_23955 [Amycolatopsis sp. NPDC026612]|uniref:hypothetical protein n=1 Tax=Amycolatopsis sp. NPDC026612 TaxID=3155466 RepID=UPI0033CFD971
MVAHHIRARRRSIRFDGRTVTLSIATKSLGIVPDDAKHRFPAAKLTDVRHTAATWRKHGEIVFEAPGAPTEIVANVPLGADKLPGNVFRYEYPKRAKVAEFLEALAEARKK